MPIFVETLRRCCECGEKFTARSWNNIRCKSCSRKRTNDIRKGLIPKPEDTAERIEEKLKKIGHGICPFCGSFAKSNSVFCKTCRTEGFDEVYRMTGRSNGWERKGHKKVKIEAGWRGQRVIGRGFTEPKAYRLP